MACNAVFNEKTQEKLKNYWLNEEFNSGIKLLQNKCTSIPNYDEFLNAFFSYNGKSLPIAEDLNNLSINERKWCYLIHNRKKEGLNALIEQLRDQVPHFSKHNESFVRKKWAEYEKFPLARHSSGIRNLCGIIEGQVTKDPEIHKSLFAHIHFSKLLAQNFSEMPPPKYSSIVAYFASLAKELPPNHDLNSFIEEMRFAFESEMQCSIEASISSSISPVIYQTLNISAHEKEQFSSRMLTPTLSAVFRNIRERIQALQKGESCLISGGWGNHAICYLVTAIEGGHYNLTFVDPAADQLKIPVKESESKRQHINPFLTLGPIDRERLCSIDFFLAQLQMSTMEQVFDDREGYFFHLANILGVDPKKDVVEEKESYCFASQHDSSGTCQLKLYEDLLKRWVGKGDHLKARKIMFQLKAKSLLRFRKAFRKKPEGEKLLSLGVAEYHQRCRKFEKMIADGLLSKEEFDSLLSEKDWTTLAKLKS